ncbi:hypothetical protein HY572_04475 [Candidatus Micrarchaeota archaeon]|nr:hypothetical protein [Candidatus Micrarchaeota archaeon]
MILRKIRESVNRFRENLKNINWPRFFGEFSASREAAHDFARLQTEHALDGLAERYQAAIEREVKDHTTRDFYDAVTEATARGVANADAELESAVQEILKKAARLQARHEREEERHPQRKQSQEQATARRLKQFVEDDLSERFRARFGLGQHFSFQQYLDDVHELTGGNHPTIGNLEWDRDAAPQQMLAQYQAALEQFSEHPEPAPQEALPAEGRLNKFKHGVKQGWGKTKRALGKVFYKQGGGPQHLSDMFQVQGLFGRGHAERKIAELLFKHHIGSRYGYDLAENLALRRDINHAFIVHIIEEQGVDKALQGIQTPGQAESWVKRLSQSAKAQNWAAVGVMATMLAGVSGPKVVAPATEQYFAQQAEPPAIRRSATPTSVAVTPSPTAPDSPKTPSPKTPAPEVTGGGPTPPPEPSLFAQYANQIVDAFQSAAKKGQANVTDKNTGVNDRILLEVLMERKAEKEKALHVGDLKLWGRNWHTKILLARDQGVKDGSITWLDENKTKADVDQNLRAILKSWNWAVPWGMDGGGLWKDADVQTVMQRYHQRMKEIPVSQGGWKQDGSASTYEDELGRTRTKSPRTPKK